MTFKGTYYSFKAEDHYVRGATAAGVARVGRHLPQLEVRVWFFRPTAAPDRIPLVANFVVHAALLIWGV